MTTSLFLCAAYVRAQAFSRKNARWMGMFLKKEVAVGVDISCGEGKKNRPH